MKNMASLACVICSAWLLMNGHDGWGWFLFAAIMLS